MSTPPGPGPVPPHQPPPGPLPPHQPPPGPSAPPPGGPFAQPSGAPFAQPPAGPFAEPTFEEIAAAGLAGDGKPRLLPEGLFEHMRADPVRAPEYLALAAVERFGPEARQWITEFRRRFPHVKPGYLAMLARTRFVRLSRYSGAVAGVAGGVGAVVDFGVLAWNQARMVIYLAAIYGEDTTSRDRAAELLMLQNMHKVVGTAQTALDVAARRTPPSELLKHSETMRQTGSLSTLATALATMVGMKMARKGAMKLIPFAAIPLGAMANAGSTKSLADRAIAFYAHRHFYERRQLPPATPH